MRQILTIVPVLAVVLLIFARCSSTSNEPITPPVDEPPEIANPSEPADTQPELDLSNVEDVTPPWLNMDAEDVHVVGNYAYVQDGLSGLQIFDVSDQSNPVWVSSVPDIYSLKGIDVVDGYAYLKHSDKFYVIDVDPPESAYLLQELSVGHNNGIADFVIRGDYIYLSCKPGLRVLDNSTPGEAFLLPVEVELNGSQRTLEISGDYAYVANVSSGLDVVNISDPHEPYWVTRLETTKDTERMGLRGNYLYICQLYHHYPNELLIVDISDPVNLHVVRTIAPFYPFRKIEFADNHAYVCRIDSTGVLSLDDPLSPVEQGSIGIQSYYGGISVSDGYCYVADSTGVFRVLDVTNPASPVEVSRVFSLDQSTGMVINDGYMYCTNNRSSFAVVDIDPADSAHVVSYIDGIRDAQELIYSGGYVYLGYNNLEDFKSEDDMKIQIVDVDPPEDAHLACEMEFDGYVTSLLSNYNLLYAVINNDPGYSLNIIDCTDPDNAEIANIVQITGGWTGAMTVLSDLLFLSVGPSINIFSLEDPFNPEFITSIESSFESSEWGIGLPIAMCDNDRNLVFIVSEYYLHVLRIESSTEFHLIAEIETGFYGNDIGIIGEKIWVSYDYSYVEIYDTSVAPHLNKLDYYIMEGQGTYFTTDGQYACYSDLYSGFNLLELQ